MKCGNMNIYGIPTSQVLYGRHTKIVFLGAPPIKISGSYIL